MLNILPLPKEVNIVEQAPHAILPSVYTAEQEWCDDIATFCELFQKILYLQGFPGLL